jgi:hypothetical protein
MLEHVNEAETRAKFQRMLKNELTFMLNLVLNYIDWLRVNKKQFKRSREFFDVEKEMQVV